MDPFASSVVRSWRNIEERTDIVTLVQCLDNWLTDTQGDSSVCKRVCFTHRRCHTPRQSPILFSSQPPPAFVIIPPFTCCVHSSAWEAGEKKYDRLLPTLPSGKTCGASQYCVKAPFSTDVPLRQRLRSEYGRGGSWDACLWQRWMVWGSTASKDKGTPSLVGLLRPPAQNQHFHSRDPERRWKWNYCRGESWLRGQRRRRSGRWRRGVKGARAFCWWSRVWFFDTVRFVTTSEQLNNSSQKILQSKSRAVRYTRFSLWLMGEEQLSNTTRFLWSLTWQYEREASLWGRRYTDNYKTHPIFM